MRCYIGLGSNMGDRRIHLEKAAHALTELCNVTRISPVYETPALVSHGAPKSWSGSYLNAVAEIEGAGTPRELLSTLKKIEREVGRRGAPKWAPRVLDLDLLIFGNELVTEEGLNIPHIEMLKRSFVLDPLKDLRASLIVPGDNTPVVVRARELKQHMPLLMWICNLTPDSFSDGGEMQTLTAFEDKIKAIESLGVQIIDLGAESTRPGAREVSSEEEIERLIPALRFLQNRYCGRHIRPYVSVDTRRASTAHHALAFGVDCINDVSGLSVIVDFNSTKFGSDLDPNRLEPNPVNKNCLTILSVVERKT